MELKDTKERIAVMMALCAWFKSQEIELHDAAYIMARLAGGIACLFAKQYNKDLKTGVDLLVKTLREAAEIGVKFDDSKE